MDSRLPGLSTLFQSLIHALTVINSQWQQMTSLDPQYINVHWIKFLKRSYAFELPQMEESVTFQVTFGLGLHSVLNKIKHCCQVLCWSTDDAMINVLGVSCLWFQTLICRQNQGTPGQKGCTTRLQSFRQLLEGALGEGITCSFLHGGMRWDLSEKPKGTTQDKSSASTNAENSHLSLIHHL